MPQPRPQPRPRPTEDEDDEERLDLLKTKWFLPAAIGGAAAIIGAVSLWLHLRG